MSAHLNTTSKAHEQQSSQSHGSNNRLIADFVTGRDTSSSLAEATDSQRTRARSTSLSLSWRRPKSTLSGLHPHEFRGTDESAVDDSQEGPWGSTAPPNSYHRSSSSVKGIFRRASTSIKGLVQRRSSFLTEETIFEQGSSAHTRPNTSQSTWGKLRGKRSLRNHRSSHDLLSDAQLASSSTTTTPTPIPSKQPTPTPFMTIPGTGDEPPIIPINTGGGAKAAVALQHEYASQLSLQNRWLHANAPSEDGNDRESGIGIAVTLPSGGTAADQEVVDDGTEDAYISRIDFIVELPTELAIQVLAHLDATALYKVCLVSHEWNKVASNQHIWRESCLRETTATYATSGPVESNAGLGVPQNLPTSDWKKIYQAKHELNQKWRAGKAKPIYLSGHTDSIYCLQFDERKIITGSRDKTIRVWDIQALTCKLVIGPPEVVEAEEILFDEHGHITHHAADGDSGKVIRSVPKVKSFPEHHNASILCLQYDDEILVTGSSDATAIVYDIKAGYRPIRRLCHHTAAVLDLVFDEKHIVTCSKDNSICVWDRQAGSLIRQLRGHAGPVNAVQMRSNTIVSCSGDFRVKLWNIDTGKNFREFIGHTKGLACSQFSENGRFIASAGNDEIIRIWNANTGECVREMRAHEKLVRSLHIDSISGRLISGSYDTDIKVWDMATGHQLLDFPRWHSSWVLSAKSDYRRIVSSGQEPKILIMDFGAEVDNIELLESQCFTDAFH